MRIEVVEYTARYGLRWARFPSGHNVPALC